MSTMTHGSLCRLLALPIGLAVGCVNNQEARQDTKQKAKQETPAQSPSASATAAPQAPTLPPGRTAEIYSIPVGPKLGIFPGRGIGPVRFGATIKTIERLMGSPCSEKTTASCRYVAQAVDFHLQDGVLVKIQIQGDERPLADKPEQTFGIFNGRFPQGAALGMYAAYVTEVLGEPLRKEPAKPTEAPIQERYFYKDFVLEFDRLKNGNVVLASVVLEKPGAGASKPSVSKPPQSKPSSP